jgi:hypothetical protein
MARLVSIDPGNNTGIAVWEDGRMVQAYLVQDSAPSAACLGAETVVEIPRIYPTGKGKGDPNDLIQVAYVAGRISAGASRVVKVYPYQWKGQVDQEILERRILERLTQWELREIPRLPKSTLHNVTDAVGIGLWYLKRMGVGGR